MTSSRKYTQKATGFIYLVPSICNGKKPGFQEKLGLGIVIAEPKERRATP